MLRIIANTIRSEKVDGQSRLFVQVLVVVFLQSSNATFDEMIIRVYNRMPMVNTDKGRKMPVTTINGVASYGLP